MQAAFNIKRASSHNLYYNDWVNDYGLFSFHPQIELYFVNDGEMEVFVNNAQTILKKGEMSVALSYVPHGYKTPVYSASSALLIPSYLCEKFITATQNRNVVNPFIRDPETVQRIKTAFDALRREDLNEIEMQGYIYVILGIVMDHLCFEETPRPIDDTLASKILFFINENYKENLSPSDIAKHFGYSNSYISRFFKDKFGITLTRYITMIKLRNAVVLMREKKHSITYCALESGFGSMRGFYRTFLAEFGCSPKEYLNQK